MASKEKNFFFPAKFLKEVHPRKFFLAKNLKKAYPRKFFPAKILVQGGMEIACKVASIPGTCVNLLLVERYKKLIEETYTEPQNEEILGSLYTRSLINQLESTTLDVAAIPQPHLIVESPKTDRSFTHGEPSIQKVIQANRDGAWEDLRELESAFLRPITTSTIVKTADNMFERLDGYGVLNCESTAGVN